MKINVFYILIVLTLVIFVEGVYIVLGDPSPADPDESTLAETTPLSTAESVAPVVVMTPQPLPTPAPIAIKTSPAPAPAPKSTTPADTPSTKRAARSSDNGYF